MTAVNLLLNLKSMLEAEFERLEITGRNKEIEKQPLKADNIINIDKNAYSKPNVYIGFRPVSVNQYDFPAVVIVPPVKAEESQKQAEYDITFVCSIRHNVKAVDNNACLEAVTFVERVKDIIIKNRNIDFFALDFTHIEWGIDILLNAPDVTVAEISCKYKKINNYC